MTQDGTNGTDKAAVPQIEHDIEQTREQLAETVEALAYKADVPARAKERATAVKDRAAEKAAVAKNRAAEKAAVAKNRATETSSHTAHAARERADTAVQVAHDTEPRTRATVAAGVAAFVAAIGAVWLLVRRRRS